MNREIKFRTWNTRVKIMSVSVDLFHGLEKWEEKETIIMQYTGLKDKNGKEIYEGDIVKLEQWSPQYYQIVFKDGGFCFISLKNADYNFSNNCKYLKDSEIIGNIYENPNLINKD